MREAIGCPPLYITVLGFDGWGKTSFMRGVRHGLTRRNIALFRGVNGYYTDGSMLTREYFKEWIELKRSTTNSTAWKDEQENTSNMTIFHGKRSVDLMWLDYPGGMLRAEQKLQDIVIRSIGESRLILLLVDGDLATREDEFPGPGVKYVGDEAQIQEVEYTNG